MTTRLRILVFPLVLMFYLLVLWLNMNESDRRSVRLERDVPAEVADRVHATIRVVGIDMSRSEFTARVNLRPEGSIAADQFTPSVNLRLLVNSIRGEQAVTFPRNERMLPIEVVFPMEGEWNRYPFDKHTHLVAFMITKRVRSADPRLALAPDESEETQPLAGTKELDGSEIVPVSVDFSAAIPGIRFRGEIEESPLRAPVRIQLTLRRSDNVIVVSIIIMATMMLLAFSLLIMVLNATRKGRADTLVPLSASVSLIFGLPALRNTQPGVPPLGAFGDYLAFLWAEVIVAVCAIVVIWTWTLRTRRREADALAPQPVPDSRKLQGTDESA